MEDPCFKAGVFHLLIFNYLTIKYLSECLCQTHPLKEEGGDAEGDEGGYPGDKDGIDSCHYGPFPSAAFVLYGDEGRYAREVEEDEDHICQGGGRGH